MKKVISLSLALVLSASMLMSCSGKSSDTASTASDNEIVVYSPHPKQVIEDGVKRFTDATGIKVNLVAAGTGELLKRIESESANPQCDVFWGGGADSINNYKKYLEPFTSESDEHIDAKYKDPEHLWVGESPLPMVIMYNTKLVSEADAPKSWMDITKPIFKGKIAMADPAKSGSAFTILSTMLTAYGKDDAQGWDFIKKFYANLDGKVLGSSSGVYKGVADGEYSLGLTLEKEAMRYVKAGADVKIVYPEEGTTAVPDGIAMVKGSKHKDAAAKFINFMLNKETQTYMYDNYNRRPVRDDVPAAEGQLALKDIKLVNYDLQWGSANKSSIIENWKKIMTGQM